MNPLIAFMNVEYLSTDVQACFVELLKSKTLSYKDEEIDLKKAIFVATTVDFDELPYALAEQMIEADTPGYASTQKTLILKEKMMCVQCFYSRFRTDDRTFDQFGSRLFRFKRIEI